MKYLFEGVPDLPLHVLYIQPRTGFFLLLTAGFPFQLLPAFSHALLSDSGVRAIDHIRTHRHEFCWVLLMRSTLGIAFESRQEDAS